MIEENVMVNKEDEQIGLMPKMEAHENTASFFCFRFISKTKCCSSERIINTIPRYFGQTLVAVIREGETFKRK
jgi:hypothetical protein